MNFAKISVILLSTTVFAAHASEMSLANQCIAYGKEVMKDNPEMVNLLSKAEIVRESVQVNNYQKLLGKQFISTEVVAKINPNQKHPGEILCLYESDATPLYFHLTTGE